MAGRLARDLSEVSVVGMAVVATVRPIAADRARTTAPPSSSC